jgi:hypothetical protein
MLGRQPDQWWRHSMLGQPDQWRRHSMLSQPDQWRRHSMLGRHGAGLLPSLAVATTAPADLVLTPLGAEGRLLDEWLTTFHLASVVLDPYTNESSWILKTAVRILDALRGADVRVNFIVTAPAAETAMFLGPIAKDFLVFPDPDRTAVRALGLTSLPAFAFVRVDRSVVAVAEGWSPSEWRRVADAIAEATSWKAPTIPAAGDPGPFHGSPALG